MIDMYTYWGFGLNIASELPMPELMPVRFDNADVTITYGNVPQQPEGEFIFKKPFNALTINEYWLDIKDVARYYAGHGNQIIIEAQPGVDEQSIRLYLLGSLMAATLYQRNHIPFHASAVNINGKLTLFTGNSGAGKSTLLANLSVRGYEVFTDDICVVRFDEATQTVYGTSSYPMIKLWEDALEKIGSESYDREYKIRPQIAKYGQFFHDDFLTEELPIERVFILNHAADADGISHNQLNAVHAFRKLGRQAYRYRLACGETTRTLLFKVITNLVNKSAVMEMNRPTTGTTVEDFTDIIETLLPRN